MMNLVILLLISLTVLSMYMSFENKISFFIVFLKVNGGLGLKRQNVF